MKRGADSEVRAFKEALKRGVGRCVLQLRTDEGRRKFRPIVLWACSRDLGYDTQVEGTRAWYLHQMIRQYEDITPFLRIVEKAMFRTFFCARGCLFDQSVELLTLFAADGHARARTALQKCYETVCELLQHSGAKAWRFWSEGHDECVYESMRRIIGQSRMTAKCRALIKKFDDQFDQRVKSQNSMRLDADAPVRVVYEKIVGGGHVGLGGVVSRSYLRRKNRLGHVDEIAELGELCMRTRSGRVRAELYKLFCFEKEAAFLDAGRLIRDARSRRAELAQSALKVLAKIRAPAVRAFALERLTKPGASAWDVAVLAKNYRDEDEEIVLKVLRGFRRASSFDRHSVYFSARDVFDLKTVRKSTDLLRYLYEVTFCSECRLHNLWAMATRRMLTDDLLRECLYDCNEDTRRYAARLLKRRKARLG